MSTQPHDSASAQRVAPDALPALDADQLARPLPTLDDPPDAQWIDRDDALAAACDRLRRRPAIAIDTEFMRERTFFPILALVQLSDGVETALVDPRAIDDLEPLAALLADRSVVKIFHACGEDLEALHHILGDVPRGVVDLQLAAAFCGHALGIGYRSLVAAFFEIDLPKGAARSDWLQRPLSAVQHRYAILDVAYVLPAYDRLRAALASRDRADWLFDAIDQLGQPDRFLPDPDTVYRRLGSVDALSARARGRARALAAWREREARRRDRPRSFVLSDGALVELARRRPHNDRALAAVPGVRRADVSRHSAAWRALFDEVDALPDAALPDRRQTIDLRPYSRIVDQLRRRVKARAKELDLPAPLLAPRRVVEGLVRHALRAQEAADDDAADALPSARRGWRREAIGDALYAEAVALLDGFEPDAGARTR